MVEPFGQRRIEVGDVAIGIDREEAGRGMIEIVDGVLEFQKHILLPFQLARHVGDGPDRQPCGAFVVDKSAGAATGCVLMDTAFFRLGVPFLLGGYISTGISEPSGLTTLDAAE